MNKQIRLIGASTSIVALLCIIAAYYQSASFWQSLLIGLGTTFLGLGLAVLAVNYFLAASDKKLAAKPVLKLIGPNIHKLHNDLFIRHLHKKLGKDQFETLIALYQKHNRNPRAFSPQQRDAIYEAVLEKKDELMSVYEALQEQLRELTLLLGWSFDSRITGASLDARISFATFKAASWDGSEDGKASVVEAYLDAEVTTSAVFAALTKHLGMKDNEWQSEAN